MKKGRKKKQHTEKKQTNRKMHRSEDLSITSPTFYHWTDAQVEEQWGLPKL